MELKETDIALLSESDKRIAEVLQRIGLLREQEQQFLTELTALRAQRTALLNMLAELYLPPGAVLAEWQFNRDLNIFERRT